MRVLNADELLSVWEQGQGHSLPVCAQVLLDAAEGESSSQSGEISIGQRDQLLLNIRQQVFGSQLVATVSCPSCNCQLELNFQASDFFAEPKTESDLGNDKQESNYIRHGDYEVHFRLPSNQDLLTIAKHVSNELARQELLERCLTEIKCNGHPAELPIPIEVIECVIGEMELVDSHANLLLALKCSECENCWKDQFDILSFFWHEIGSWARGVLHEVHVLASAYGWSESEILALSAVRRRRYLEMVAG